MTRRRAGRGLYCRCGHPQSFHAGGHGKCRCGCERLNIWPKGQQGIEVLEELEPPLTRRRLPDGTYVCRAGRYRVRCHDCGGVYETKSFPRELATRRRCRGCADELRRAKSKKRPTPLAGDYKHGTRASYVKGCRCDECKQANRQYESERGKRMTAGTWDGMVNAASARRHILRLSKAGIGRDTVHDIAGVGVTSITEIRAGVRRRIRRSVREAILAVTTDAMHDARLLDSGPTQALLRKLIERGFTKTELARRLGSKGKAPALQLLKGPLVTARNKHKVERLYKELTEMEKKEKAVASRRRRQDDGRALDALRVICLVRAIEARGAGFNLGTWIEMILGWDTERAFLAIQSCMEEGWLAPGPEPRQTEMGARRVEAMRRPTRTS